MSVLVGMIADDLTGALDAAAPFAERGLRTIVVVTPDGLDAADRQLVADADIICINTASREIEIDEAARRVTAATKALLAHEPGLLFKKVDSRLKGHLHAELRAMLNASGRSEIVLAPAIPDLGRVVIAGAVTGLGIDQPIGVMQRCGGLPVTAPDTPDAASLDRVGAELIGQGQTVIAAGARGLAAALARRFPARPAPSLGRMPQPALLAIGSRDPITRAQIALAVDELHPRRMLAPNGTVPSTTTLAGVTLVTVEAGEPAEPGAIVAARFAKGIAALVEAQPPASMFISGGETAYAILTRLGVHVIELGGEALPGVPFAHAKIAGEHVVILTKSGGFGPPETISLLVGVPAELD